MADHIVRVLGRVAYRVSDVCRPDPHLEKCEHFADATERYTLKLDYMTDTHDMYTARWRERCLHSCKECLPPVDVEIMS